MVVHGIRGSALLAGISQIGLCPRPSRAFPMILSRSGSQTSPIPATTAIPEPVTLLLVALGSLTVLRRGGELGRRWTFPTGEEVAARRTDDV